MDVDSPDVETTELLQAAEEAARRGGSVLEDWSRRFTVSEKSRKNLVTEADFAAQEAIHSFLHARFPTHDFLGEEGLCESNGDGRWRWVIDPLDGTSNYVHRFPYYAVSVGLECDGRLVLGAVYDPNRDETFSARAGAGATLNGTPIAPSDVADLREAMAVASLPVGGGAGDPAVARFLRMIPKAQTVQRTGSAALNLCYVACGRIDCYWSTSLKPWDVAAGVVIIGEAGGRTTRIDGRPVDIHVSDLLASNGTTLHESVSAALLEAEKG